MNIYLGGKDIRKSGILVVLLLAIVFISGCAENAQENEIESEEKVTSVEGATPSVTEQVTKSAGGNTGEGSLSGQEETSPDEGKEVIIRVKRTRARECWMKKTRARAMKLLLQTNLWITIRQLFRLQKGQNILPLLHLQGMQDLKTLLIKEELILFSLLLT